MRARVKILALSLLALLATGAAMMLSTARGSGEPEAPYWSVSGERLASGKTQEAVIESDSGTEGVLHATIGSAQVEVKCSTDNISGGLLEGSAAKHAGKTSGVFEMKTCKLFEKEGETLKELSKCEVPNIKSLKLVGKLMLEGTKAAAGTQAVVVIEPKELTEGKPEIASIPINGTECSVKGTYLLEGKVAADVVPNNEEFTFLTWKFPSSAIATAWDPTSEEEEVSVALKFDGNAATLESEDKVTLKSGLTFGGGTAPVKGIEAPSWAVGGKQLEEGQEKTTETKPVSSPAIWTAPIKGTETETRCSKAAWNEPAVQGSAAQQQGKLKVKTFELSECKLYAKEGSEFKEQSKCEVSPISSKKLVGSLWYEGSKSERGSKTAIVLEPETTTEGKPVIAEETIKGASCSYVEEKYKIEGELTAIPKTENKQVKVIGLEFLPIVVVWLPGRHEAKREPKLKHGTETVKFKVEELPVETTTHEEFGIGSNPLGGC